jgi:predicted signal transduction protein with EAL and GGDEF domain
MSTWTEELTAQADPAAILEVLTDPDACGRWAPIDFEVSSLDGDRLRPGTKAQVAGRLAGREVGFDVEILAADEERLALLANGPVALDVEYLLRALPGGSHVRASIAVRPSRPGLAGRLLAQATAAVLAGGALRAGLASLVREAEDLALAV